MTAPTLVVFDEACDTADVLAAVYEPRGITVERRRPSLEPASTECWPSVVLMDGDRSAAAAVDSPRVLIGRAFYSDDASARRATDRTLSPLFHFPDLIAAVDSLLAERAAA
jgi:hypothetical protein